MKSDSRQHKLDRVVGGVQPCMSRELHLCIVRLSGDHLSTSYVMNLGNQ